MKFNFVLAPTAFILLLAGNAQAATQADVMLEGNIVATTCVITANNGAASLNLGSFGKTVFDTAKSQVGAEPLIVRLESCNPGEVGSLQVTGMVASGDNDIFVSSVDKSAGFMLKNEDGVTQVSNGTSIPITVDQDGVLQYSFQAGMGVFDIADVQPGAYNAPIKLSFVSN